MKELNVSSRLRFPPEAVTQTFGVLAKRGAGKSNVAAVMAEEMFRLGLPFVVVDPVSAWWGLRSDRNGKHPGLPIPIFGGYHGDVPLERGGAELIADLIVDESLSCVLDVSAFDSEAAKREFLATFAERLFRRKAQPGKGTPLHLFLEEADDYAPQRLTSREGGMARCLGAFQRIVKQGRARGLGATMISQRSASLNKDLLTQIETLIVLRTTSPQDRKAISAWVEYHGEAKEMLEELHRLADGEAWVWSPWMNVVKKVQFYRRHTFDSGATPTLSSRRAAATLADVDLDNIRSQMAATIERAKEEDPKLLRQRVSKLEKELAGQKAETKVERVEVPVVREQDIERVKAAVKDVVRGFEGASAALEEVKSVVQQIYTLGLRHSPNLRAAQQIIVTQTSRTPTEIARAVERQLAKPKAASSASSSSEPLNKAERSILQVLAQYPQGRSKNQVAVLSGYAVNGGGFANALSHLRTLDYITRREPIQITDAGIAAIEGQWESLPTGPALLDHWLNKTGKKGLGKAEREILKSLVSIYPMTASKEEVGANTGYEPSGGGFSNALSRLRTLELIHGPGSALSASETLVEG